MAVKLTDAEIQEMLAYDRRLWFPVQRGEKADIAEGIGLSLTRFILGAPTIGLAGSGMALADDALREQARARLIGMAIDRLNEKNGSQITLPEEDIHAIAAKGTRAPKRAMMEGWASTAATYTGIGAIINAMSQDGYNAKQTAKEHAAILEAQDQFIRKLTALESEPKTPTAIG